MGGCVSLQISCDQVLNRVGSCFCGKGNLIRNLDKNLAALGNAMGVLKARRDDVLRRVRWKEGNGLQRLNEVQVWLMRVQTIENQFDDLSSTKVSELQSLCLCGFCSKNLKSSFHFGRKVFLMLKEVENLKSEGVFEVVAEPSMRYMVEQMPLQPIILGRETMLETAWNRLMDDEIGIMGLFGMGGVGKTTLLTQINNKFCEAIYGFVIVIWVVVSSELRVENIQDYIAEKLGLCGGEWNQKDARHKVIDLYNHLKNIKFVLLLDDIWRKVDLTEIGVPFPTRENGCKVVFTTRSREVCGHMGVDDPMEVQCLAKNDAWALFEKKVGSLTLKSHPGIPEQARKVAEKCCGLPLALNVIGETMSCKRTIQEWLHAIQVLNSYAADFSGMDDQILPILKYSYDSLKDDQIKSCFKYCSLFPEDYLMEKDKLIGYWICEGFLSAREGREATINQGYEIIGTLVRACLLMEEVSHQGKVKMHDVVREMALWISSDLGKNREKCIVRAGVGLFEVPKVDNWRNVERISLMNNKIEKIYGCPRCPKLTTLFLQENPSLTSLSGEFFRFMPNLIVLDLSKNWYLDRLPAEISKLVSLKYLDLSRTNIAHLPACLQKLKKLMHLYLEDMRSLESINGISNLSSLRTLTLLRCGGLKFDESFKELLLLKHLEVLTIKIKSRLVLEKLFFSNMWRKCIKKLEIEGIWGLSNFNLTKNNGMDFPNLSSVTIEESDLTDLTWLLFAPNLIHLSLKNLAGLEEVVSKEKADKHQLQGIIPFGKLETLMMLNLRVVESIYWTPLPFPCLREMHIERCPVLGKLPLDYKSIAEVEDFVIKCEANDWFEDVEWEDEATRVRFLPSRRMITGYG